MKAEIKSNDALRPDNFFYVLVLVSFASSLEYGDEQLLPSSYDSLSVSLGSSLAALSRLTFGRSLLQTSASLFVSPILETKPSLVVLGFSCLCFGISTMLAAFTTSYFQILILRALNGLCLAFTVPSLRNFMSNVTNESNRGKGFGWYYFFTFSGAIIWGFVATSFGSVHIHFIGFIFLGWRLVFFLFGVLSIILSFCILYIAPKFDEHFQTRNKLTSKTEIKIRLPFWKRCRIVLQKRTFLLIATQGVVGSMPWKAFGYLAVILQRAGTGFTDAQAALVVAAFQIGITIGTILGGFIADKLHQLSKNRGYIVTAQISAFSLFPLSFLCLIVIPRDPGYVVSLCLAFFLFGSLISWGGAVNNSLFSSTTTQDLKSTVFALNYGVEGSLSSAAIPLVGYLASGEGAEQSQQLSNTIVKLCFFASIWLITIYSFLYKPYRIERDEVLAMRNSFSKEDASPEELEPLT